MLSISRALVTAVAGCEVGSKDGAGGGDSTRQISRAQPTSGIDELNLRHMRRAVHQRASVCAPVTEARAIAESATMSILGQIVNQIWRSDSGRNQLGVRDLNASESRVWNESSRAPQPSADHPRPRDRSSVSGAPRIPPMRFRRAKNSRHATSDNVCYV